MMLDFASWMRSLDYILQFKKWSNIDVSICESSAKLFDPSIMDVIYRRAFKADFVNKNV